jgi:D-alanyl-lipoteichoic acid acyltransferase DltB (MBOAT superfamily)
MQLIIWGYFKKLCVADRIGELIDPIFASPESYPAVISLASGLLFLIQIYCDFSGYTDIATGVARFFGVELMINWKRPLLSTSTRDFWRRWHISLTSWLRDYVYIPLGGNRQPFHLMLLSILLVFTLSGLWHGANLTYVAWGIANGLLVVGETTARRLGFVAGGSRPLGWVLVILTQAVLFTVFRAESAQDAAYILGSIFSTELLTVSVAQALETAFPIFSLLLTLLAVLILLAKETYEEAGWLNITWRSARPLFYVAVLWLIFGIGAFNTDEFIYFQF